MQSLGGAAPSAPSAPAISATPQDARAAPVQIPAQAKADIRSPEPKPAPTKAADMAHTPAQSAPATPAPQAKPSALPPLAKLDTATRPLADTKPEPRAEPKPSAPAKPETKVAAPAKADAKPAAPGKPALKSEPVKAETPALRVAKVEKSEKVEKAERAEKAEKARLAQEAAAERGAVMNAVTAWAHAWSERDVPAYLAHYASDFEPGKGLTRKAWAEERHARITGKGRIEVRVEKPQVEVNGALATVRFHQVYVSDRLSASSRKTLTLERQRNGKWQITRESTG
ncbi:DUF4440 domain-containing protein [Noviherbaspirillum sp. DKR-6]|uniref:DUF4440 domain-containing protein n=2 Tax=Noviherbaspirillum pedocola TaxID=2801341 RepID=A0A934SS27_9BURK|nr:DUF4440 domain-containing protein [Noviherbaspirillum pedocola]